MVANMVPPSRGGLGSRLTKEAHQFIQEESRRRGMSLADLIHEMIKVYQDRSFLEHKFAELHERFDEVQGQLAKLHAPEQHSSP